jgi:integrase
MIAQPALARGSIVERVSSFLHSGLRGENAARYRDAVDGFRSELRRRGLDLEALDECQLDYLLADHIIDMYEKFESTRGIGLAAMLLAAMSKRRPRHRYKVAWKCLDVWRTRTPPRQAPTVPIELAFAVINWLVLGGRPCEACVTLLCFAGLLRVGEALSLRGQDVHFTQGKVIIVLGISKRGLEQKVVIEEPSLVDWLRAYRARHAPRHASQLFCPAGYHSFNRWFNRAASDLGFGAVTWTSHGLRRGGATELLRRGFPLSAIMLYGRWLGERSCREYLRRGEVAVLRMRQDIPTSAWTRCQKLGSLGAAVWVSAVDTVSVKL